MSAKFALLLVTFSVGALLVEGNPFYKQVLLGKADDSCAGRCGLSGTDTSKPCQCNVACETYGDCCADFDTLCKSCDSRCNAAYDSKWPCQCNTQCSEYSNCCPDYNQLCTGGTAGTTSVPPGTITNDELRALSNKLHTDDVNGVSGIELNLQATTTSGSTTDRAPLPLFTSIPTDALNGPTISKLVSLFKYYTVQASVTEVLSPERTAEETAFLDAVIATSVMQQAHSFLVTKGLADPDIQVFKEYLRTIWLDQYNRGGGTKGSSGLEHVFAAEISNGGISGFHNWVYYYLEEQKEDMNYLGYISQINLGVGSMIEMPMNWRNIYKSISSISVASSPELDLAVATVCFLARPNGKCQLQGSSGNNYAYQTYTLTQNGVTYVGSAYPTIP